MCFALDNTNNNIININNHMCQVSVSVSGKRLLNQSKIQPLFPSSIMDHRDQRVVDEERENEWCSSSSSIGKNSDDDDDDDDDDDGDEVESKVKMSSPFDSSLAALEQALPIRRGISRFYNGKSKSFAILSDASCSSMEDLAKPENAYSRKRKNLLAYNLLYDKGQASLLKSSGFRGGFAKRPIQSSGSTLSLAVAISNCGRPIDENGSSPETNRCANSRPPSHSPPTSPHAPWRSFSLADLQQCAASASAINSNLPPSLMGKRT